MDQMTDTPPTTTVAAAARYRAGVLAVTPALLLVAAAWHPYLPGRLPNDTAVAEAVLPDPTRWGLAHVAAGVAFGFAVLAFVAIRNQLREAGEQRWSGAGLPLVVLGSALYTMLPGMELAPLAAAESGADVAAVQAALAPWLVPVLMAGAGMFGLGVVGFAAGIIRSGLLGPGTAGLVATALVVMAVSRLVPLAAFQLYVQGLAALVALWPLAYRIWRPPLAGSARSGRTGTAARPAG
jgi:hypothetical protein